MMTREQWVELRRRQGHRIFICSSCEPQHLEPEYNKWWHEFKTGHQMVYYLYKPTDIPFVWEVKKIEDDSVRI